MNVLIVGNGGREHALGWKVKQSDKVEQLFFAPGNGGTASIGTNINISVEEIEKLADFAIDNKIGMTIVGPEVPLQLGVVDAFRKRGLCIFGPDKKAAQLEASKAFAKKFMDTYKIPTARYETYHSCEKALQSLANWSFPLVIKADGLAAGKGVVICESLAEAQIAIKDMMEDKAFGSAGDSVVIEEFLVGLEASLLCFTDGNVIVPMESAQDYKRAKDGDKGLNTGGMGSISPAVHYKNGMGDEIAKKTLEGIQQEGFDYRGVVYIGLMITADGIKVLEYNVRFGDPETEVLMLRLDSDLLEIVACVEEKRLAEMNIQWKKEASVCVVMASGGYPETYQTGMPIEIKQSLNEKATCFHGGTIEENGVVKTSGGRVLMVSALGETLETARKNVYDTIENIVFQGCYYRKDIGKM